MEKEGKGREKQQCGIACFKILTFLASYFNPNIKVTQATSKKEQERHMLPMGV